MSSEQQENKEFSEDVSEQAYDQQNGEAENGAGGDSATENGAGQENQEDRSISYYFLS